MNDWLPPFAAAGLLGITVNHVHQLARRRHWRRSGHGRSVRYWTEDVLDEGVRRATRVSVAAGSVGVEDPRDAGRHPGA